MPWKTIMVLLAVAVLAVVAYDIATYEHTVPRQAEAPK
jgi:type II secretory pathway component PulK